MTRWIIAIQEYDFTIKYCKASNNKVADTLSRYAVEHIEEHQRNPEEVKILNIKYQLPINVSDRLNNIVVEQENDPSIMAKKQQLIEREHPRYKIFNNIVYKLMNNVWKVMLPQQLLEPITWACHESLAHVGPYRCYLALREDFICNNMVRRVKNILKTCHICQTANYPNYHTCIEMGSIVTKGKGEILCIDFLGPLPRAGRRLRHLIVCIDAFTKAVRLYPVQRPTTKAVLNVILKKYIPEHGSIKRVLTDQGKQFQNQVWADTLNEHGIQAVLTAIRRPQGNLAERVNKELGRLFRIYCCENHNTWPQYIKFFEKTINENYNYTTGYTPVELESGQRPTRVWSNILKSLSTANMPLPDHLKNAEAKARIEKATRNRAEKFTQSHKMVVFEVGEKVLLKANPVGKSSDNTAKKFFRLFDGPYTLSEKVGKNTFIVFDNNKNKTVGKFHSSAFRKYYCKN